MARKRMLSLGMVAVLAAATATALASPAAAAPPQSAPTPTQSASVPDPGLSPTPYQGWNTYFGLGGDFTTTEVLDVADFLISSGLSKAGYDIVWLDGGWQDAVPRGEDGILRGDTTRFPDGMASLADAIHAKGLKAGIYTDAGPYMPGHCGLGSGGGYYQTDADTFAAWGYDAVKVDFLCGISANLDPKVAFTEFAKALRNNSSGRPMIFNLCNPVTSPDWGNYPDWQQSTNTWTYAPQIAESWRTYTDVGFVGEIKYKDILRNFDANARHPEVAGPGHWNDPDYLGPQLGTSDEEFRSQMALWSLSAAPLVIGSDPRTFTQTTLDTLTNPDVLAVNQDVLGKQGVRVGAAGVHETWVKPLADGSMAVGLVNRGDTPAEISTTAKAIGLKATRLTIKDAWTHAVTEANEKIRAEVPAHGVGLLIVSKSQTAAGTPRVVLGTPTVTAVDGTTVSPTGNLLVSPGAKLTTRVTVRNDGVIPVESPVVSLGTPEGWTATATSPQPARVLPGGSAEVNFALTVPASAPMGTKGATASLRFPSSGGPVTMVSPSLTVTVAPTAPSGTDEPLSHHPWVSATSGWMQPAIDESVGGGNPIKVAGTIHATGLGVASPSDIRYYTGGACTRLTGIVGIDDVVSNVGPEGGTATFSIVADGKTLWDSGTVVRGNAVGFDVDLSGARELVLHVGDAGDGGYNDRADWADPLITCS